MRPVLNKRLYILKMVKGWKLLWNILLKKSNYFIIISHPVNGTTFVQYEKSCLTIRLLVKFFKTLKSPVMLRYTITFLIIAVIAAILGFGGIAAGAAGIAKIFFYIFLVLFVGSLLFGNRAGRNL